MGADMQGCEMFPVMGRNTKRSLGLRSILRGLVLRAAVLLLLLMPLSQPVLAAAPDARFIELSEQLGDAIRKGQDVQVVALAGQLRAGKLAVGREIDFAEGAAQLRLHNNDAAEKLLKRYVAGKGKFGKKAKDMLAEIAARKTLLGKTWRRKTSLLPGDTAFADGSYIWAGTLGDMAGNNLGLEFVNARGQGEWRTISGGTSGEGYRASAIMADGGLAVASTAYGPTLVKQAYPTAARAAAYDAQGNLKWSFTRPLSSGSYGINIFRGPDGGVIFQYSEYRQDHDGNIILGLNARGEAIWSYTLPDKVALLEGLSVAAQDDAGNLYLHYFAKKPKLVVLSPQGKVLRSMLIRHRLNPRYDDYIIKRSVNDDVTVGTVSSDGRVMFLYAIHDKSANSIGDTAVYAIDTATGNVLWVNEYGKNSPLTFHSPNLQYGQGSLYFAALEPHADNAKAASFSVRRYDPQNGTMTGRYAYAEPGANAVRMAGMTVLNDGVLTGLGYGKENEAFFIHKRDFGAEPPVAQSPDAPGQPGLAGVPSAPVAKLPSLEEIAALKRQAMANINDASTKLKACRAKGAAPARIGTIRDINSDWGYLVVTLDPQKSTAGKLVALTSDGREIPLKAGKLSGGTLLSATPMSGKLDGLASGMVVAASGTTPPPVCNVEQAAVTRAQMAYDAISQGSKSN
ncbi:hypothetical protein CSC3H3_05005 [Thalassospira marina]|uniref:Uncharacterized protein n=2 Tax=Thalassospira marina TaxID=2048283 RepID=A0ABN5FDU6_9PROT|nr:hypothetical protein CSC3H3_05005 [Thalassospira marina]